MLRPVGDTVERWVGGDTWEEASKRPLQARILQVGALSSEQGRVHPGQVSEIREENCNSILFPPSSTSKQCGAGDYTVLHKC